MKTAFLHEQQIVQQFNEGSATAFEIIYQRYHTSIFLIAQRYLRDADDAKDVRSHTFLRLFERQHELKFDNLTVLSAWLHVTARNACFDMIRSKELHIDKQVKILLAFTDNEKEIFEITDKEAVILERLLAGVNDLPPRLKEVFKLRIYDGLKFKEISSLLRTDLSTIKKRYSRAIEILRSILNFNL